MGIEFEKLKEGECLLCSAVGRLTGEHKIKASLLKNEFGSRKTKFLGIDGPKILQSSKSKHVHFNFKICMDCNSSRTQAGDRAFDQLHRGLKESLAKGEELTDGNNHPNCELSVEDTTDYCRYFSKMICCYLADVGGPRSRSLSAFALGLSDKNRIFLDISEDKQYEANLAEMDTEGIAQHGRLIFRFDDKKKWVKSIESSLSAGGISYEFWVQLRWFDKLELHFKFGHLVRKARASLEQD